MGTQRFEPVERIELGQADGDVSIKGWDERAIELAVDGDESECTIEAGAQALVLSCRAPLALRVPRATVVQVGEVSGDLLLSGLDRAVSVQTVRGDVFVGAGNGSISLQAVHGHLGVERLSGPFSAAETHGDLHLKNISTARVGSVHGGVNARGVASECALGVVRGDVRLRDVAGVATLEEAHGDFRGQDLRGGLTARQVRGSLSLKTAVTPGCTYRARAEGDVLARFPPETSARFTLQAQGDLSAKGFEVNEPEPGRFVGQVGTGEAEVVLEAGGSLSVKLRGTEDEHAWGFTMEGLGAKIEAEIAAHMGEFDGAQIAAHEIEKAMRQVEHEIARAQQQAERAAERAQERARHVEERARRAQEKALERAKRFQAKVDLDWQPRGRGEAGTRARPVRSSPSNEEQMAVLSMLQAGKITVQEAEKLLKALGG